MPPCVQAHPLRYLRLVTLGGGHSVKDDVVIPYVRVHCSVGSSLGIPVKLAELPFVYRGARPMDMEAADEEDLVSNTRLDKEYPL